MRRNCELSEEVHRTRVPTCLARCARILPWTDLSVSANISDSDADKGDTPFPPQPPAVEDQHIHDLEIAVQRQLFDGKSLKKAPPWSVDYVGWNGPLSVTVGLSTLRFHDPELDPLTRLFSCM